MPRVRFLDQGVDVEVPVGSSILQAAQKAPAPEGSACGGVCACSTCHVIVRKGFDSIPEASEDEEDQLDNAPGLTPCSRLACQAVPDGSSDVTVEVPDWNRNLARESH